jgi:endoglucanase
VPLILLTVLAGGMAACGDDGENDALVRLDQAGYAAGETKVAVLLAPRDASGARVQVIDAHGETVLEPRLGAGRGGWNDAFRDVRPIDVSVLREQGFYRIRVRGTVRAESEPFRVTTTAADLFDPLVSDSLRYFQAHRDGADQVSGEWQRRPAHLSDRSATVYQRPAFDTDGRPSADLVEAAGPVDVEGGWYDAGDFLKFTHTTAYAVALMLIAQRDGLARDGIAAESRHGIGWLDKMWDGETGTLYTQVGIGSGRDFLGDHDSWRLPEDDDRLDVRPGDQRYFQRYRPVFRAAAPGEQISPNLAGRVAAAFALAAQVEGRDDPAHGRTHLDAAAQLFDLAGIDRDGELVTAEPRSFYPRTAGPTIWRWPRPSWPWPAACSVTSGRRDGRGRPLPGPAGTSPRKAPPCSASTTSVLWPTRNWCGCCGTTRSPVRRRTSTRRWTTCGAGSTRERRRRP